MGLLGGLAKAGVAKKVYDEARKPQNQAKLKSLFSKATGKGDDKTDGAGGGAGRSR